MISCASVASRTRARQGQWAPLTGVLRTHRLEGGGRSVDRAARLPGSGAVPRASAAGAERGDEVLDRGDLPRELGEVAADGIPFVAVARSGRSHGVAFEHPRGPGPGLG